MTQEGFKPSGWRILIEPIDLPAVSKGGILFAPVTQELAKLAAVVAKVIALGCEAYQDTSKFTTGEPWCKEGDWVLIARYGGAKFYYEGKEYRLINDDEILGVVDDPTSVTYAKGL